jgi:branched-chain amino acid transport system ATP-binding protein
LRRISVSRGLELRGAHAGYLGAPVLKDVALTVTPGSVTCLLGANGAGKTTLARVLAGLLSPTTGTLTLDGRDIIKLPAHHRVRAGISLVPEGRLLFNELSVRDNLLLGGCTRSAAERELGLVRAEALFPKLGALMDQPAGTLSGGEQQMVAVGRALVAEPRFLLLDEPSLGLAPILVRNILAAARTLADQGVGVLLIEQNVTASLEIADRAVVLEQGQTLLAGPADDVRADPRVVASYLGGVA